MRPQQFAEEDACSATVLKTGLASMRPQQFAEEDSDVTVTKSTRVHASMRPQQFAEEDASARPSTRRAGRMLQ